MEEIQKKIAALKELVSKLLELQTFDHKMKYGYLNNSLNKTTSSQKI